MKEMSRNLFGAVCIALLLLCARYAWGHGQHFTPEENNWLERQKAVDGTKCCNRFDTVTGIRVNWRTHQGRYEVQLGTTWHRVEPGNVMAHNQADPSPFGHEALLFYSIIGGRLHLWCFSPEPLM